MEKFLLVEMHDDTIEIAEITEAEVAEVKTVVRHILDNPIDEDSSDYGQYGHIDGFETFVKYIPNGGVKTIRDIKVGHVEEFLL